MAIPLKTLLRLPTKFVAFLSDAEGAGMLSVGAAAAAGTGAAAAAPLAVPLALAAGGFFILDVCLDARAERKSEEDSDDLRRKLNAIFANTDELVRRSPFSPAAAQRIAECERGERDLAHLIAPPGDPGAAVIELYKALKRQPPGGTDAELLRDIQKGIDGLEGGLEAIAKLAEASAEQNLAALEAAAEAIRSTVGENFAALGDYLATRDAALHAKLNERFAELLARIEETTGRIDTTTQQTHATVQRIEKKLEHPWKPTPPPRSLIGLPTRLGNLFTGRDVESLTAGHFSAPAPMGNPPMVLHGSMGTGKTTLAAEWLYHLYDCGLIDHAIMLPAGDAAALPSLVEGLALNLGLVREDEGPVLAETSRRALGRWPPWDRTIPRWPSTSPI